MSVTTGQIQKIMRGGVWGRNITSCVIGLALVGLVVTCIFIAMGGMAGQTVHIGSYSFPRAALQPWPARIYVVATMVTFGAMAIASLYLIRGVFADLALGNIFCADNVRRIRNLGWLAIAIGVFAWLIPFTNAAFFMLAGHADVTSRAEPPLFSGLGQIVSGGLYILLSWIMAVGLGVREDADELRRDAELVI